MREFSEMMGDYPQMIKYSPYLMRDLSEMMREFPQMDSNLNLGE